MLLLLGENPMPTKERLRIEQERAAYVAANGPGCQICGTVPKTRGLQWDHDHKTHAHRGWLCHRCNRALPSWITVEWLIDAFVYLGGDYKAFYRRYYDRVG